MQIRLLSDLHLEGNSFTYEHAGEDVVVLAGDIHTRNRHEELISLIPEDVRVVMVAGNHEYYRGEYHDVHEYLRGLEVKYPNFRFLHNEGITINDVEFFGGMMATDFSLHGFDIQPHAMRDASDMINDFEVSYIKRESGRVEAWTVVDHMEEFTAFQQALSGWIRHTEGRKRVVISHFVPSPQCVHPKWKGSSLNPYFTVDMERFMGWEGLWLFGHTHDSHDLMVGDTRLVCNPHGYRNENARGFDPKLVIEIS